jgi:hypothetical protein
MTVTHRTSSPWQAQVGHRDGEAGHGGATAGPGHRIGTGRDATWRTAAVIISQSGSDLNPHGPDLQKQLVTDSAVVLANRILAGQGMILMCPRGDSHLTYMTPVTITTEFTLVSGGAR